MPLRNAAPQLGCEQFGRHHDQGPASLQGAAQSLEQLSGQGGLHDLKRVIGNGAGMERCGHYETGAAARLLSPRGTVGGSPDPAARAKLLRDLFRERGIGIDDRDRRGLHLGDRIQQAEHGGRVQPQVTAALVRVAKPAQMKPLERSHEAGPAIGFQVDAGSGPHANQPFLLEAAVSGRGRLPVHALRLGHVAYARQPFSWAPVAEKDTSDNAVPQLIDDDGARLLATHAGLPINAATRIQGDIDPSCARLVPLKLMRLLALLALGLMAGSSAAAQGPPESLRRAARAAEAGYERTVRWLAPGTWVARGGHCDETVGRFCLTFDSASKPPRRPERAEVGEARERALASLRTFHSASPGDLDAVGPLVRLLVEARRGDEAVTAAETFARETPDSAWGDWLSGYALHAAGDDSAAAVRFGRALARVPAAEREHITALDWLLSPGERKRVRNLTAPERKAYADRFWRISDPMWLTAASEVWVEHVARHVEARLLARVPVVTGMLRWGRDLEELTVRYGAPIARERDYGSTDLSFVEHFDTSALAYGPESLLDHGLPPLAPGEAWPLKSPSARSGHSPPSIRTAAPLPHQLTRFPAGDSMRVRLDAQVVVGEGARAEALLAAWSWLGDAAARTVAHLSGDTAIVRLEVLVPRDSMVYSAEVFEPAARRLHLARYLMAPLPRAPVQLSDILLTRPLPDSASAETELPALTSLVIPADMLLGVRVALAGLSAGEPLQIEVSFDRADSPSALARVVSWTGRLLGIASESRPPRVRWQEASRADGALQVNVRAPRRLGLYHVQVAVRASSGSANARRLIRVVSARGAES